MGFHKFDKLHKSPLFFNNNKNMVSDGSIDRKVWLNKLEAWIMFPQGLLMPMPKNVECYLGLWWMNMVLKNLWSGTPGSGDAVQAGF